MEEQKKDKIHLVPNTSVSIFKLGDNIANYLTHDYELVTTEESGDYYDTYIFYDIPVDIWVDSETRLIIDTIRCQISCILDNHELIGMPYSDFTRIFKVKHDNVDQLYSYGPKVNGRNYTVYDFDELGLMIWVWRDRIRTILVSKVEPD